LTDVGRGQQRRHRGQHQDAGFRIAGKTGTAQVVGLGKDVGANKDHSWFVSYAPAYKPEISVLALIEIQVSAANTPRRPCAPLYDVYYQKTRPQQEAPRTTSVENSLRE